jgi:hypothetical protein
MAQSLSWEVSATSFWFASFLGLVSGTVSLLFAHSFAAAATHSHALTEGRSGEFLGNPRLLLRTSSATDPDA